MHAYGHNLREACQIDSAYKGASLDWLLGAWIPAAPQGCQASGETPGYDPSPGGMHISM